MYHRHNTSAALCPDKQDYLAENKCKSRIHQRSFNQLGSPSLLFRPAQALTFVQIRSWPQTLKQLQALLKTCSLEQKGAD